MKHRLSAEDVQALLEAPDRESRVGLRNVVIMLCMVLAGLKVGEIVGKEGDPDATEGGLRLSDVDFHKGTLRVVGKKGARVLEVPLQLQQFLRAWLDIRPRQTAGTGGRDDSGTAGGKAAEGEAVRRTGGRNPASELVFTTIKGTKIQNRYVRRMLHDYGRAAGLGVDVKPSLLRDVYARRVLKETGDLRELAARLGHQHLASSLRYLEGDEE